VEFGINYRFKGPSISNMKFNSLYLAGYAVLAGAAPVEQDKRQLNGLLGSLAGTLGANQIYDYIVLGGGTAGLTIAKRLAENRSVTVALIEAGSLYQVTDPVLESTPGGDVTFVGEFFGNYFDRFS
jgi:choline dehydrogenase